MSEADNYPDYDLSFLDGSTGDDLTALSRGIDDAARTLEKRTRDIADNAQGVTADRVHGDLVSIKQALDVAATDAAAAASAFRNMKAAWDTWKKNAPRRAEIAFAELAVFDAERQLMAADGPHAALFRRALKEAKAKLKDLITRREDADEALAEALERAKEMIPETKTPLDVDGTTPVVPAPRADAPATRSDAPGPAVTLPPLAAAPAPGTALPPAVTTPAPAPGTSLSGGPESLPAAAAAGGGLDPARAAAVAGLLGQTQQPQAAAAPQAQPQMAMPVMPQVPAAAAQPQKQPENPFAGGDTSSLYDLIDALAPAAAVAAPLTLPSMSNPGLTPISLSTPPGPSSTFVPATPWNTPGASLSVAPAANPVVTGTSISGLVTDNNVTGRPDGAPPRTATGPSPASHLATATAAAGAAPNPAAAHTSPAGMGAPMMPMAPMMGGPGISGAGKERETVKAEQSSEEFLLTGGPAVSEAVPGGTIARKEN